MLTSPQGRGVPVKPASASAASLRGAGCSCEVGWRSHFTTARSPTTTSSFVWSTSNPRSPAQRSACQRITESGGSMRPASDSTTRLSNASAAPSPGCARLSASPEATHGTPYDTPRASRTITYQRSTRDSSSRMQATSVKGSSIRAASPDLRAGRSADGSVRDSSRSTRSRSRVTSGQRAPRPRVRSHQPRPADRHANGWPRHSPPSAP